MQLIMAKTEIAPQQVSRAFQYLVLLKRQQKELDAEIKEAQEVAIQEAIASGKTGQIAQIDGAKITFKLVPVKPKPTEDISNMQERIGFLQTSLKVINEARIKEINSAVEVLNAEMRSLTVNDEILELEQAIEEDMAKLTGEKVGQIAITLPK
jgi:hypothetical protein